MKVGLKFCGGCNPDYDRIALVAELRMRLQDKVEFVYDDQNEIDILLVLHGCRRACAEFDKMTEISIYQISRISDVNTFIDEMENL